MLNTKILSCKTPSMASLKTLKPHLFYTLLKYQKPSFFTHIIFQYHHSQRKFTTNTQFKISSDIETYSENKESIEMINDFKNKGKNSLDVIFKRAVGLIDETSEYSENELDEKNNEVIQKLKKIETDVRNMKGISKLTETKKKGIIFNVKGMVTSLFSVFTSEPKMFTSELQGESDTKKVKYVSKNVELTPELKMFIGCLHEKGYFKDANFLKLNELEFSQFSTDYARGYLRKAAERFCNDHPEIAKCLSESDVKRLALYGCPRDAKKTVFAAKRLRSYFSIQEDIVCRPCVLNNSCKFKYHSVGKKYDEFDFADVMHILISYSLELGPPELILTDEIEYSISNLLKQLVEHNH